MKFCCDRYSIGITIGAIYILASAVIFVLSCITIGQYDQIKDPERVKRLKSEAIETIIFCFVTALIAAIFIVGIVKRSHYLILPWLMLAIYLFYPSCKTLYGWFFFAGMGGSPLYMYLIILLITVLAIGSQIAILYLSCSLFKQIRQEIHEMEIGSASDIY